MSALIFLNSALFIILSLLHLYWSLGGEWGKGAAVPVKADGRLSFSPGALGTFMVSVGLLFFAAITLGNDGLFDQWLNRKYVRYATGLIAVIFILRAMGDFKLVGFTKKVKNTRFAINDTRLYSPLCLLMGINSALITMID